MTEHRRVKGDPRLGFRSAATCEDCGKELDEADLKSTAPNLCDSCETARAYDRASAEVEPEGTSLTFAGEACEGFADRVGDMKNWYVRLTTLDGRRIEAVLVGSGLDVKIDGDTWYDAVSYREADEDGLAEDDAEVKTVRVREVFVY